MNIIKIEALTKSFDTKKVLNNLSLEVFPGECLCIMGRSGCGKSVLMRIIAGLMKPDSGIVKFKEKEIDYNSPSFLRKYRQNFGMVFQNSALFDYMNVYDNISFGLRYYLKKKEKDIYSIVFSVLEELELKESAYIFPEELSGGMKKRVALARALVLNPEVLIYDEPTTGLDAVMVRNIDNMIKDMQKKRKNTSIVITHDVNSAMRIADRIAIHSDGVILEHGNRQEIMKSDNIQTKLILTGTIDE
ncbi:MAG: ATP-binding cassette domain-containing protein [Candidatus Muirbacterium halophilum]|nr:ATP-binding cassette domain-containing protein [Candidatus Muirbacterium halophilum]